MQLSESQVRIVEDFLRSRAVSLACPACRQTALCGGTALRFLDASDEADRTGTPVIELSCTYCGHIRLFSAVVMGFCEANMFG
jgi:hypothetical protein